MFWYTNYDECRGMFYFDVGTLIFLSESPWQYSEAINIAFKYSTNVAFKQGQSISCQTPYNIDCDECKFWSHENKYLLFNFRYT